MESFNQDTNLKNFRNSVLFRSFEKRIISNKNESAKVLSQCILSPDSANNR
jgi:hypothetical protein